MIKIIQTALFILLWLPSISTYGNECDVEKVKERFYGGIITLSQPIAVKDIEMHEVVEIFVGNKKQILPFGYINKSWLKLKKEKKDGDCFVRFKQRSVNDTPMNGGSSGYILIRGKEMIGSITTIARE
ncbi:MAG: hypothetical protein Q9M18_01695 [Mariprofundaceae bacterium]|nr:hypothetical protein [Mariprofundaceae bacterium]